jgi:hypothetical protein
MKMTLPPGFGEDGPEEVDTPVSQLSPHAAPFHPLFEPVNIAIFNDGIPTMSLPTEFDRFKILRGIGDEALDENFPPDAHEAAELDAADAFVLQMADLAWMEEMEERARTSFSHVKKRWEVRRAQGPSGHPKPAMHLVAPRQHLANHRAVCTVVKYNEAQRRLGFGDKIQPHQEIKLHGRVQLRQSKMAKSLNPIQQPRKNS